MFIFLFNFILCFPRLEFLYYYIFIRLKKADLLKKTICHENVGD